MENLLTYQQDALRTEAPLSTPFARLEHAALGFITETGEIATQVKRIAIYGKTLENLDGDHTLREHIAEEIGDVMWFLAIASHTCGLNVFETLTQVPFGLDLKTVVRQLSRQVGRFDEDLGDIAVGLLGQHLPTVFGARLHLIWRSLQALATLIGTPIDQIAGDNIAKLRVRFPNKFTQEAAEARADKGGLDARNS